MRFLVLIILVFTFCSCQDTKKSDTSANQNKISLIKEEDSSIYVRYADGKSEQIITKNYGLECLVSPDSQKIAVNSYPLSNLRITEVYYLGENGKMESNAINLSSIVWDSIAKEYGLHKDEILFPKTNFVKWNDDGSAIKVKATGSTEAGQKIEKVLELEIKN